MRRGLINQLFDLLRKPGTGKPGTGKPGSGKPGTGKPGAGESTARARPARGKAPAPARDIETARVTFEYTPSLDGDPDPGEVVWTWVPYEEDPAQGKDRPVVILGRRGKNLVAVPLTSRPHDNEPQVAVGTGPWDREGRPSYAKLERLLEVDPAQVRREGAVLARAHFDAVVAGVQREGSR